MKLTGARSLSTVAISAALIAGSLIAGAAPAHGFTLGPSAFTAVGSQPEGAARAFNVLAVANHSGNSLSILDAQTMMVTDTINGLGAPMSVAITGGLPNLRYIVASTVPPSLKVVTGTSIIGSAPLPGTFPVQVLVHPLDENAWFVVDALGSVIRQDGLAGVSTTLTLGGNPKNAAFNANGDTLYVVDTQGRLFSIDPASMAIMREYAMPGGNLTGLAVQGNRAFVSSNAGSVYKVNLSTGAVQEFMLGPYYTDIAVYWFGKYLYLINRDAQSLDIVTASSGLLVNSLPLGAEPSRIVIDDGLYDVYTVNMTGSVSKVRVNPEPPGPPAGWMSKSCTLSSGRVTARLAWNPATSPGDLTLEGYRFQLKRPSGRWGTGDYTRRLETTGTLTTRGYRAGQRIRLRVQSVSLAGGGPWLRGTCVVTR